MNQPVLVPSLIPRQALLRSLSRLAGFMVLLISTLVAADEPVAKSRLGGHAIGHHDTVAYHFLASDPQEDAVKGSKDHIVEYKGAKWNFASAESAARFAADPEKYSPAYNGHCANALSLGEGLIRTDGTHWEIFDNQLYLFYAGRGRDRWLSVDDISEFKATADAAWERLR